MKDVFLLYDDTCCMYEIVLPNNLKKKEFADGGYLW